MGAVIDPRDEAAEGFETHHAGHVYALDDAHGVERNLREHLIFHGGVAKLQ